MAGTRQPFLPPVQELGVAVDPQSEGSHSGSSGAGALVSGPLRFCCERLRVLAHPAEEPLALERGELYSGLVVDEVLGMQHIAQDLYTQTVPGEYADTMPYLNGGFETEKGFFAWFSLYELARDPRFLNVAS